MARSGTSLETIDLTAVVGGNDANEVFEALEADNGIPEGALKQVVLAMLRAVQGNEASVAPIVVPEGASLVNAGPTLWFWRSGLLDGTKPWVVYSAGGAETAKFGIRIHYPKSDSSPEQFRVVVVNRELAMQQHPDAFIADRVYAFAA